MPKLIRLARANHNLPWKPILTCALLLPLAAPVQAQPGPTAAGQMRPPPIIVNSRLGGTSANRAVTTLHDALARAARDPGDDLIQFDPAVFGGAATTIRLAEAITVGGSSAGHDRIDASPVEGGVTLEASSCSDAGVIVAGDASLTLIGLTIRGGAQRAVLVTDSGRLTLEDVTIERGGGPAVALFGQSRASLRRCRIVDSRTHGLELHGQATALLDEVDLLRNGQSGLAAFDQTGVEARECRFDGNGDWNLVLTDNTGARLEECTLRQGQFANADVGGSASFEAIGCTIADGPRFGVFGTGRSSISLVRTRLHKHRGRAVELQGSSILTVSASQIESNGEYGLILFGDSSVRATQTVFARNGAHGVSLRGQAGGQFDRCLFVANRYSGIGCLDDHDGGEIHATRCTFTQNGMRPIYRGPLHLDPLVPTPLRIQGSTVICLAQPHATVELFLDRAGEATHYLKTIPADHRGRFQVDCRNVPDGWVMTATATAGGATSEFNVIAGSRVTPVLNALVARTGSLSDDAGEVNLDTVLRRWRPGTHLVFHLVNPPTAAVESYVRYLVDRLEDWTGGTVQAELRVGRLAGKPARAIVIPIRYVESGSPQLMGRGGVTFMKWDTAGFFLSPMEIVLATGDDAGDTCPRVLAHEIGHTLGLCHVRVGLLSRMQGSPSPGKAFVNDFSPMMTYYDVLALQTLYDPRNAGGATLRQILARGTLPHGQPARIVTTSDRPGQPTFSPAAPRPRKPARLPATPR